MYDDNRLLGSLCQSVTENHGSCHPWCCWVRATYTNGNGIIAIVGLKVAVTYMTMDTCPITMWYIL